MVKIHVYWDDAVIFIEGERKHFSKCSISRRTRNILLGIFGLFADGYQAQKEV